MLTLFQIDQNRLTSAVITEEPRSLPYNTLWLDLFHPTKEEERLIEKWLSVEVPTREEMQEIEVSSRLYVEKGALVMNLPILDKSSAQVPESTTVTFVLAGNRLVTLRYADPKPLSQFVERISRQPTMFNSGEQILMGLLEQIADRLADILEGATANLETLSHKILQTGAPSNNGMDFKEILRDIGHVGDIATKAKDSLLNLNRLVLFLTNQSEIKKDSKTRLDTLRRDVASIDEHATFLSEKVSFTLDATLGLINIEQNNIIKIFSIAAAGFLPPMLIASIYGMNFHAMPELSWQHGYPFALFLMILSAALPYLYFKRKKWV